MEVSQGGLWGYGDILSADGIDIMPMYFTVEEMEEYLDEVLQCKHLGKEGRFYPVGRLASVSTINILYETRDTWTTLVNKVNSKPYTFFKNWFEEDINQILDEEDLGRAILHKEVLFFHQVLENALDHFIQALYAVNHCYFPSRKRTKPAVNEFQYKPNDCLTRLFTIVTNGADSDTIEVAVDELRTMTLELTEYGRLHFSPRAEANGEAVFSNGRNI